MASHQVSVANEGKEKKNHDSSCPKATTVLLGAFSSYT